MTHNGATYRKITNFGHRYLEHDYLFGRPTKIVTTAVEDGIGINASKTIEYISLSDSISSIAMNSTDHRKNTDWSWYVKHDSISIGYIVTTVTFLKENGISVNGTFRWDIIGMMP